MMRVFLASLALLLAACGATETPVPFVPTTTLQGAIVPTRITATPTFTATATQTPSATSTSTPSPTATETPAPTDTPTPTATPTVTDTPEPSPTMTEAAMGISLLEPGVEASGTINNNNFEAVFQFEAQTGDIVNIRLRRLEGTLDPLLRLLDPNNDRIGQNDDADSSTRDAAIEQLEIPASGIYTIIATRYEAEDGETEGTFGLMLERFSTNAGLRPILIEANETVRGRITDATYEVRYRFEGRAGDIVTIGLRATGGGLDPLLILEDANGRVLIQNDDFDDLNSRIADFPLPVTGEYIIVATRYDGADGGTFGGYELRLQQQPQAPPATPDNNPPEAREPRTGSISAREFAVPFPLMMRPNTSVTIEMRAVSGNLDPLLVILDPAGREIARNDDYGDDALDARIDNLLLEGGEYTIVATRFDQQRGLTTGAFEIVLQPGTPQGRTNATLSQSIDFGMSVTQRLNTPEDVVIYTFMGREGSNVSIQMDAISGDIDPLLVLTDNIGREIAINDELDDSGNASIENITLPQDGPYTIIAQAYDGSGEFELRLDGP